MGTLWRTICRIACISKDLEFGLKRTGKGRLIKLVTFCRSMAEGTSSQPHGAWDGTANLPEHEVIGERSEVAEIQGTSTCLGEQFPKFAGGYDPKGAQSWVIKVERIFQTMGCPEGCKVPYATYLLIGEAKTWWMVAKMTIQKEWGRISWDVFRTYFLKNYLPMSWKASKAMELWELRQGCMSVEEYTVRYNDLVQYWSCYSEPENERILCAHYERGLRDDIRKVVCSLQLTNFIQLVTECLVAEEIIRGEQSVSQFGGSTKGKRVSEGVSEPCAQLIASGEGVRLSSKKRKRGCFRCGGPHLIKDCPQTSTQLVSQPVSPQQTLTTEASGRKDQECFYCGKKGHYRRDCWYLVGISTVTQGEISVRENIECFNCGKMGHYQKECRRLPRNYAAAHGKTIERPKKKVEVSITSVFQAVDSEELVRGKRYSCKRLLGVL